MTPMDPDLPDDFDDLADTEATVTCPYCGERLTLALDPGGGMVQEYVEDCQVCCQPWAVQVVYQDDGQAEVVLTRADGT